MAYDEKLASKIIDDQAKEIERLETHNNQLISRGHDLAAENQELRVEIDHLRSVAGAVTPGPSARQIIRERIARLADGEVI